MSGNEEGELYYKPFQTGGLVENFNKTIRAMLAKEFGGNWNI